MERLSNGLHTKKSNWQPKTRELSVETWKDDQIRIVRMLEIKFAEQPRKWKRSFSFYAAEEVIEVWTWIWADRSQIKAFMA